MSTEANRSLTILRRWQVEGKTGLSRSTIYRRMREGTFPHAISLGGRMVGWREADVDQFLQNPARYRASVQVVQDAREGQACEMGAAPGAASMIPSMRRG
jgi:prophage regulatory protein